MGASLGFQNRKKDHLGACEERDESAHQGCLPSRGCGSLGKIHGASQADQGNDEQCEFVKREHFNLQVVRDIPASGQYGSGSRSTERSAVPR
ncbi:MAG: hypothetical protein KGL35_17745, partial [Bradyrhizobium sp.]|nr:hypothetical protein [Bradyrhizobium sp.]